MIPSPIRLPSDQRKQHLILILTIVIWIGSQFIAFLYGQEKRNLLTGHYSLSGVKTDILPIKEWHPFPTADNREGWNKVPEQVRKAHIKRAEQLLNCEWPTPKASVFLDFVRNGNRSRYEAISFGRRGQLADLVLGECMEGKGRFLDDIANGIWTICEESYWGVSAHIGVQKRGSGLPDVTEPTVDLFAAETGTLLAWTHYLLKRQLDTLSPLLTERIRDEVRRRILTPNLERDDFWWMGFKRKVNNWNPWICSNWLTAALLLEEDPDRRAQSVYKILRCLDNFLNDYPEDGGCDEGPGYWGRAGASLYDCLELLTSVSQNKISFFDRPLIHEIGRYIARVYIHDQYFINFADAPAKHEADAAVIFRYGRAINDPAMTGFGAFLAKQQNLGTGRIDGSFGVLGRVLPALFSLDALMTTKPAEPLIRDFWLPGLQVMGARSFNGSAKSFYIAAKGGHNNESHNHNDVGNFVLYVDGDPVLIDVGVETYTSKTFSKDRYSIWTMQSAYHNLPSINGVMQKDGAQYKASNLTYNETDAAAVFSLEIAGAYPKDASVKEWQRTLTLNRGKNVELHERYELGEVKQNLQWSFMSFRIPSLIEDGKILLKSAKGSPLFLLFRKDCFKVLIEPIMIRDKRLKASWDEKVYRIVLKAMNTALKDDYRFIVQQ
ncbi:MAG: heparinase II/III family protein [bacterium]